MTWTRKVTKMHKSYRLDFINSGRKGSHGNLGQNFARIYCQFPISSVALKKFHKWFSSSPMYSFVYDILVKKKAILLLATGHTTASRYLCKFGTGSITHLPNSLMSRVPDYPHYFSESSTLLCQNGNHIPCHGFGD
jgi:Na+/melibiose symporter-like transporter